MLYMSAIASLCKRQPLVIVAYHVITYFVTLYTICDDGNRVVNHA
jgi:hypothetical protein